MNKSSTDTDVETLVHKHTHTTENECLTTFVTDFEKDCHSEIVAGIISHFLAIQPTAVYFFTIVFFFFNFLLSTGSERSYLTGSCEP